MRLDDMVRYLKIIDLMRSVGLITTIHRIAKQQKLVSRSTVYRDMKKIKKCGLVDTCINSTGNEEIYVTEKGYSIMDAFVALEGIF